MVHFVDHHESHAVGSFLVCPWEEAALLSLDGWGEWASSWSGHAVRGHRVRPLGEAFFPHSIGAFYSAATEFCGFQPKYDEGKTMGLAPTGDPNRFRDEVDRMIRVEGFAGVRLDLSWFDFPSLGGRLCGKRMINAFGSSRRPGEAIEDRHRDVAAAFQFVLEERVLQICDRLQEETATRHLVYGGGVALNSVANGRIVRETRFEDVFIMPGAGDNGTAIGAAACVHSRLTQGDRKPGRLHHSIPFLGRSFSADEIEVLLRDAKATYERSENVVEEAAALLAEGLIVGWFQGRMEFGPRSLGGRSILADPTRVDTKGRINAEVKHREAFRPFAPAVTRERAADYFEIDIDVPYMLKVAKVHEPMRAAIPAVVHCDGSARLQTVDSAMSPRFHALLLAFGRRSGHPVLLNTSFNVMGEPIVASPLDALRCFYSTGLDALIIEDFLLRKELARSNPEEAVGDGTPSICPGTMVS